MNELCWTWVWEIWLHNRVGYTFDSGLALFGCYNASGAKVLLPGLTQTLREVALFDGSVCSWGEYVSVRGNSLLVTPRRQQVG